MSPVVRAPASSANLGSGFDALGAALGVWAEFGLVDGAVPDGCQQVDQHHPAAVAYRRAGGDGSVWVRSSIPNGRGMGFSGTMRVGGAALAFARAGRDEEVCRDEVLDIAAALEGHADNVAASVYGGVVAVVGATVVRIPLAAEVQLVLWVPRAVTASTDASRAALTPTVSRADAADAIARTAVTVAALATGDWSALRTAMDDRFHQPQRLAALPGSAAALRACWEAGARAAWLSGSGPTVAALCLPEEAGSVADAVRARMGDRDGATVRVVDLAQRGVHLVRQPAIG